MRWQRKKCIAVTGILALTAAFLCPGQPVRRVQAAEESERELYEEYLGRLAAIEHRGDIEEMGFAVVEDQIFPIPPVILETEEGAEAGNAAGAENTQNPEDGNASGSGTTVGTEDEIPEDAVYMIPAFDKQYNRLALFFADVDGNILYKTEQLETNSCVRGRLKQPEMSIVAVAFQDLNDDDKMDVVLLTSCQGETGNYAGKTYKVGDVLFQGETESSFYRDYRIADKINRFGMNKSANSIVAFVRDGKSTEFLYTAATLQELQRRNFRVAQEQCYTRTFGKLGRLQVVPGTYRIADYDIFMIYLVSEEGEIVFRLQPMGEYDNLYALKGVSCRDIDGDGLKDIVVLARYSYGGEMGQIATRTDYQIYYQRTSGFSLDTEIKSYYQCEEDETMEALVEKARAYWGWKTEDD